MLDESSKEISIIQSECDKMSEKWESAVEEQFNEGIAFQELQLAAQLKSLLISSADKIKSIQIDRGFEIIVRLL
jgi:hypothetical protein